MLHPTRRQNVGEGGKRLDPRSRTFGEKKEDLKTRRLTRKKERYFEGSKFGVGAREKGDLDHWVMNQVPGILKPIDLTKKGREAISRNMSSKIRIVLNAAPSGENRIC